MNTKTLQRYEHNDTDDLTGVNFVSLLKHEDFYKFYDKEIKKVKWYSKYFEDYMFRGKNMLLSGQHLKPMYMLTWAIANGEGKNYLNAVKNELEDVTCLLFKKVYLASDNVIDVNVDRIVISEKNGVEELELLNISCKYMHLVMM